MSFQYMYIYIYIYGGCDGIYWTEWGYYNQQMDTYWRTHKEWLVSSERDCHFMDCDTSQYIILFSVTSEPTIINKGHFNTQTVNTCENSSDFKDWL